ncbi:MAG: glycosyltransferase family 39 protein [Lachnospiraceae bacterium]|nr:glycosyltransferase family 39 protein [Lachnospiraceae bacterium]
MKDKVKISWIDYKWWFIFAVFTVFLVIRVGEKVQDLFYSSDNPFIKGGFIFLTLVIYALIASVIYLVSRRVGVIKNRAFLILSEVVMWLLLVEAFILRYLFPSAINHNNLVFVKSSMISLNNEKIFFEGAASLYADVLSVMFAFLGNHEIMVYYLQFIIQILTIILIFFAIRFLIGVISAYVTVALVTLSFCFGEAVRLYQPEVVYLFLWSLVFFLISFYYRLSCRDIGLNEKARYFGLIIIGFLVGVTLYFDLVGFLLFITGFYVLFITRNDLSQYIFKNFFYLIGFIIGFFVMLFRESVLRSNIVMENFVNWFNRFTFEFSLNINIPRESLPVLIVISMLCMILVIFFLQNGNKSLTVFAFYILMLCVVFPMLGLKTVNLNMWITLAWAAMAGLGLQSLVSYAAGNIKDVEDIYPDDELDPDENIDSDSDEEIKLAVSVEVKVEVKDVSASELEAEEIKEVSSSELEAEETIEVNENIKSEPKQESRYDTSTGIKYLDNPLPLPAKPVRRVMDYPYEISADKMYYDVEVDGADDYDM